MKQAQLDFTLLARVDTFPLGQFPILSLDHFLLPYIKHIDFEMSGQGGRNAITAGSKIFKKVAAGNAKAKTGSVRIGVATEAEGWKRPLETAPESIGGRLKEYIEAWDQGPKPGTVEMVARYGRASSSPQGRHTLLILGMLSLINYKQGRGAYKHRPPEAYDGGMFRQGWK